MPLPTATPSAPAHPFPWGWVTPLTQLESFAHFQEIQRRIWDGARDDLVPIHMLVTLAKNGGMVLGAFTPDGPPALGGMVGICLGWPGFGQGQGAEGLKFCSHIVGVLPEWHGRGIGRGIKEAQRQILLAEGRMDWVTWTYDPLQRVNAVLNIHRLGATCQTYLTNIYGQMTDTLNAGMPTDRFQVDWQIDSPRVAHALAQGGVAGTWRALPLRRLITQAAPSPHAHLRLPGEDGPDDLAGQALAVPLPDSVSALRQASPDYLLQWRFWLRQVMMARFAQGYQVVDCVLLPDQGWHYILAPGDVG